MQIDFGLRRAPREARIVVAMSGGVDSSVTAALAARTGAEVIGVTMQLYDHGEAVKRTGACCAGQDIYDARQVAAAPYRPPVYGHARAAQPLCWGAGEGRSRS